MAMALDNTQLQYSSLYKIIVSSNGAQEVQNYVRAWSYFDFCVMKGLDADVRVWNAVTYAVSYAVRPMLLELCC